MDDNFVKICAVCNTKKVLITFIKNIQNVKRVILKRVLKRYYNNNDKILQQRRDEYASFKDMDIRLKALEEKLSVNNNLT